MNSKAIKLLLVSCLLFQAGCDITFKRKSMPEEMTPATTSQSEPQQVVKSITKVEFRSNDADVISSYFASAKNSNMRKDMISHTALTKRQKRSIVIGKVVPRYIQVVPLPIKLEKALSPLPLHIIRVLAGAHVILMDVKSRRILNIIKI